MSAVPVWQLLLIMFGSMGVGFLAGATIMYPIGRRHGITAMSITFKEWYRENHHKAIDAIVRKAAARVHGSAAAEDRDP